MYNSVIQCMIRWTIYTVLERSGMIFASPLDNPEGPVILNDGSLYCVEMGVSTGCVTKISFDGKKINRLAKTGRPNGLVVDHNGTLWVAESATPSLLKMTPDGEYETWLEDNFIFPNDLAFGPDGKLYMTDSGIHPYDLAPQGTIRSDYLNLNYDGRIYQIDIKQRKVTQIDSGLKFANGITFGPDKKLYVNETITGNIYSYELEGNSIGTRKLFGNVIDPSGPPGWRGPDGMKFGEDGNLYCTVYGQKDVTVMDNFGNIIKRIETIGRFPTNLTFGHDQQRRIFITEVEKGHIEVVDVSTPGLKLYD